MTDLPDGLPNPPSGPNMRVPEPKKKGAIIAGSLAVALVLGGGGAYLALRGEPEPQASESPSAQPSTTPTPTASQPEVAPTPELPAMPGDVVSWANRPFLGEEVLVPYADNSSDLYAPMWLPQLRGVTAMTTSLLTNYALMADGTVRSWGSNLEGALGNGEDLYADSIQVVKDLTGVKQIVAMPESVFAVLDDGTVKAWGSNEFGVLGTGSTDRSSNVPVTVTGLSNVKSLTVGLQTVYALLEDGTVMAWGSNLIGQLGANTRVSTASVPVPVADLSGVVSLTASSQSAFAILNDGTAVGWGYNSFVEPPATGLKEPYFIKPVNVPGLKNVKQIAAGSVTGFAVLHDGTVMAFGETEHGLFGDGKDLKEVQEATVVPGLKQVQEVQMGRRAAYAILADGTLMSWGANWRGLLGRGSTDEELHSAVQPVAGLAGVKDLVLGIDTAHAVLADGSVWSWGFSMVLMSDTQTHGDVIAEPQDFSGVTGATSLVTSDLGQFAIVPVQ